MIFRENTSFSTSKADIGENMKDSDMGLLPAYSKENYLQDVMYFEASAPLLLPHVAWEADRSHLPPCGSGGRAAATALGSSLVACTTIKMMFRCLKWTL